MAFYLLKSGGSATGDAGRSASAPTGSFTSIGAANYYGSMAALLAATTTPVAGDRIYISDAHSESVDDLSLITPSTALNGPPLVYMTVDDGDVETAAIAASAQFTMADDILLTGDEVNKSYFYGIYFEITDEFAMSTVGTNLVFEACTLKVTGQLDYYVIGASDNGSIEYYDCTFIADTDGDPGTFRVSNGRIINLHNCTFTGGTTTPTAWSAIGGGINGGGVVGFYGCDLSPITQIVNADVDNISFDNIDVTVEGCKINASMDWMAPDAYSRNKIILAIRNGSATDEAEHQFYYQCGTSYVESDITVYRDASTAFPISGEKISLKAVSDADISRFYPFKFRFASQYVEFSDAASDVLTIHLISSDATLTDADIWAELVYPDGTTFSQPNVLSTKETDPLGAGTALSTNTEAWTGRTTETRYEIALDTSSDAGSDGPAMIFIFIAKPSITVYLDPVLALS